MGMQVRLVLYASSEDRARGAATAAFSEIARLDRILSHHLVDSELTRLTASPPGEPRRVGEELFVVLERALDLSRRTGGAFDPTVGPLTELWRRSRHAGRLPTATELDRARARVGPDRLHLDPENRTVTLRADDMRLDLGGLAKGYVLDRARHALRQHGVDRSLVEAGGDVVVGAAPPGADGWRIAVGGSPATTTSAGRPVASAETRPREETRARDEIASPDASVIEGPAGAPTPPTEGGPCVVVLAAAALSTSGDTEQFVEIDGVRYSHVVDPRTGLGLTSRARATVVARDGLTADGLATALTLLEERAGRRLLAAYPEAGAVVDRANGEGWRRAWPDCQRDTARTGTPPDETGSGVPVPDVAIDVGEVVGTA